MRPTKNCDQATTESFKCCPSSRRLSAVSTITNTALFRPRPRFFPAHDHGFYPDTTTAVVFCPYPLKHKPGCSELRKKLTARAPEDIIARTIALRTTSIA